MKSVVLGVLAALALVVWLAMPRARTSPPRAAHEAVERTPAREAVLAQRPPAESLAEALRRHPFLEYDSSAARLCVPAGRHAVDGDLVLPDPLPLHLAAGAELVLPPDGVLVAGALVAAGTDEAPVRLSPRDRERGFSVLVLGTAGASSVRGVEVRGADQIRRGAWRSVGCVTFAGADVRLERCTVIGARGEDAVHLLGVTFHCTSCRFADGASDLLDGDAVSGEVADCRFAGAGGDAIDLAEARVTIRGCAFERIADKAVSIGEGTRAELHDGHVVCAGIGVAVKDGSIATVDGLVVDAVEHFVAACYVKKDGLGPATLRLRRLQWRGEGSPPYLAQTGCTLDVDGSAVATRPVDVDALYRQRVLGK